MKLSSLFPSKYLKADDISAPITVTIQKFAHEEMGQDEEKETKAVMYFSDHAKGMVMNKTKGVLIADLYGDETDNWIGKRITLFKTRVLMRGDMVDSIGVRAPDGAEAPTEPVKNPLVAPTNPTLTGPTEWREKVITEVTELTGKKDGKPITVWNLKLKSGEVVGTIDRNLSNMAFSMVSPAAGPETLVDMTVEPGNKPGVIRLVTIESGDIPF